jgi:hypothetical protein
MPSRRRIRSALCLALLVCLAAGVHAETPAAPQGPGDADVRELGRRLDAMGGQLDHLEAATDAAVRQTLMQQHWLAMQDYMGVLHSRWGAGAPWMLDAESRGGPGASACPMLGGSGAAWPLPEGVPPKPYAQQMRAHLRALHEQLGGIAKAGAPEERARLLQEHWQTVYRDMQRMRGLGWMWGAGLMGRAPAPGAAEVEPLPEPDSPGAKLVSSYCVQCHARPSPQLLTSAQWGRVIGRMHVRIEGRVTPMKTPSEEEMKTILAYMKQHARE